ncbi:MAG: GGDEF domain-containing protein [Eubacteriales bacterium]|nr:GGDEF domain-containing protein [Eubacteriales bacterium]
MILDNFKFASDRNKFTRGEIYLNDDYSINHGNAAGREFFANISNTSICELAQPSVKAEFKTFLDELPKNGKGRIITILNDRYDEAHLMDISASWFMLSEPHYKLKITDICSIYECFDRDTESLWKYRIFLSMMQDYLFDYDCTSGMLSIYYYLGNRSMRFFYNSLDDFQAILVNDAGSDEKLAETAVSICKRIKNCTMDFEDTIVSGFLSKNHEQQKFKVHARFNNSDNFSPKVHGMITLLSDNEDELPYFMTKSGMDSATGLLNKRALIEYTRKILSNSNPDTDSHYMILIDIDNFKNINDTYGHAVGDKAISIVANAISDSLMNLGMAGRYGGDEFYIFTEDINDEESLRYLLRNIRGYVLDRAKDQLDIENLTLSMGISKYPELGTSYEDLLEYADRAVYIAKEKGKNRYIIYRPEMHDRKPASSAKGGRIMTNYDEESRIMNEAIKNLFLKKADKIAEDVRRIRKAFDLDCIDIYFRDSAANADAGAAMKLRYSSGTYAGMLKAETFLSSPKYMELFDDNGLNILGSHLNLKLCAPEVYAALDKVGCMTLIQKVKFGDDSEPEFFISFCKMNRSQKWSNAEINYLTMYSDLIYEVLKKER